MCVYNRRKIVVLAGCGVVSLLSCPPLAIALSEQEKLFIAEAVRMKDQAMASGDQPFGAVVVRSGEIIGYGPSRVIIDRNPDAHAERVALWDAQRRLGTKDISGAVMYSTSRPCDTCENALALGKVDRMYFGLSAIDAGIPKRW